MTLLGPGLGNGRPGAPFLARPLLEKWGFELFHPPGPILGPSAAMRDRPDCDLSFLFGVDDREWESPKQKPPRLVLTQWPAIRSFTDGVGCSLQLFHEIRCSFGTALLVPTYGPFHIRGPHLRGSEPAYRSLTIARSSRCSCSQGTVMALPDFRSAIRRATSSSQAS